MQLLFKEKDPLPQLQGRRPLALASVQKGPAGAPEPPRGGDAGSRPALEHAGFWSAGCLLLSETRLQLP